MQPQQHNIVRARACMHLPMTTKFVTRMLNSLTRGVKLCCFRPAILSSHSQEAGNGLGERGSDTTFDKGLTLASDAPSSRICQVLRTR
jgi:hypothetical protein